ncbi:hypothetical protein SAMN05518801_12229 [Novosphingobium sp. CF614]|nr:hypothetical protein SAMN05518801_12229 [Novosphingobium sp. CF614]
MRSSAKIRLLTLPGPDIRGGMRGLRLQILILFAVLCAALHAPAMAHAGHDEHGESGALVVDADQAPMDQAPVDQAGADDGSSRDSSSDASQEFFHHHHCPMAMTAECAQGADDVLANRDMLRPGEAAVLVSRTSAPPVEPPLA